MISEKQKKYLEEVERLKEIKIKPGIYHHRNGKQLIYHILSVDEEKNLVHLQGKNGSEQTKTLHWCKKNLILYPLHNG
jgi:hypothetical protein